MPTESTMQMMKLFQDNFKKDILSTDLLIRLVKKKLNDCDANLALLRQNTRNLCSDFIAFDRKLNIIERCLAQRPKIKYDTEDDDDDDNDLTSIDSFTAFTDSEVNEDEKNQQLIRLVLNAEGRCEYYKYEEMDNSYLNVTIRPVGLGNAQYLSSSSCSTDRSSFVSSNSENDYSLSHYSFSSGYSTN